MSTNPTNQALDGDEPSQTEIFDVTVVGAGLAGLITALEAARRGLTVNLVEKRSHVGGRATSTDRDGFRLNQGPHAVYVGGELNETLKRFGIGPTGVAPSDGGEGIVGGRRGRVPAGPMSMLQTKMLSAGAKPKLAAALIKIGRQDTTSLSHTSTDTWVDSLSNDAEVREVMKGIATIATYNAALDIASADATAKNLQLVLNDGVLYVHRGWQTIVDGLQKQVDASASIRRTKATVGKITTADGTWTTNVGETSVHSQTVVMAAGTPGTADRLFGLDIFAANAGPKVSASVLDLGISSPPSTPSLFDFGRSLYLSTHSVATGLSQPEHLLVTLARYRRGDDTLSATDTEQKLMAHAKAAGIEIDWIAMRRYLHEMTVAHGMPLATQGGLSGRPAVKVPNLTGAFIAGDWVGASGLLADASAASAIEAVEGVLSQVKTTHAR